LADRQPEVARGGCSAWVGRLRCCLLRQWALPFLVVGSAVVIGGLRAALMVGAVAVGGVVVVVAAAVSLVVDMGFSFVFSFVDAEVSWGVATAVLAGGSPLEGVLWRQEGIANGVVPS
jgi:hypothetical protein